MSQCVGQIWQKGQKYQLVRPIYSTGISNTWKRIKLTGELWRKTAKVTVSSWMVVGGWLSRFIGVLVVTKD
jgi:hypothetical protein